MPPMTFPHTQLLTVLKTGEAVAISELAVRLPEFSWRELFLAIQALNRQGTIRLDKRGYDFFVISVPHPPHPTSSAACLYVE